MHRPSHSAHEGPERIGYFLVQVRSFLANDPLVGVVMEDLGSGVKHRFDTARAVGEFLEEWSRFPAAPP